MTKLLPHERLQKARKDRGFASASEAAQAFNWTISTYVQHENGSREISRTAAPRYAEAFRVTAGWLLWGEAMATRGSTAKLRLVGRIGAGQEVRPVDEEVEFVDLRIAAHAEAFEVVGNSMLPVARHKDIVIAAAPRALRDLIGTECVVELDDGRRFFKTVERGSAPGLFTLISYNAEPIRDVRVTAAGPLMGILRS